MQNKKKTKWIMVFAVIVVVIIGGILGVVYGIPAYNNYHAYQSAEKMLEDGQYEEAKNAFWALATYKDSADKIKECDYQKALSLLKDKKYSEAKEIFEELGSYEDCEKQITACEYGRAEEYLAENDYEDAKAIFEKLGEYKDSTDKIKACQYGMAGKYIENKEYDKARVIYKELGKYEEAEKKLKECDYQEALKKLEDEEYDAAVKQLESLKGYSDAKKKIKEAHWKKAYTEVINDWSVVKHLSLEHGRYTGQGDDYNYLEEYFGDIAYEYYTLKDLDGDKIPELLLYSGETDMTAVLTYKSKLVYVGTFYNASFSKKYGIVENKSFRGGGDYWDYYIPKFTFNKKNIEKISQQYILEDSIMNLTSSADDADTYYYLIGKKTKGIDVIESKNTDYGKIYKITKASFMSLYNKIFDNAEAFGEMCNTSLGDSDTIRNY